MSARIRLIGELHSTHHDGAVLTVTDSEEFARHNAHLVTAQRAAGLVAAGHAEWVGDQPPAVAPAPLPEMVEQPESLVDAAIAALQAERGGG